MKISRIQKAKGYRVFRDFTWPTAGLPDFAQFNVIYGWNGAGKTSLSNIFRQIQRKEMLDEGEVEIVLDQTRVSGLDFATAALPAVRVFNRDTVDRNIFEVPDQQLPPVFFLGEDSAEKQRTIQSLKQQLDEFSKRENQLGRDNSDIDSALEAFCSEEAKGIKNLLTVAGGGPFNNYNAAHFKVAVLQLSELDLPPNALTEKQRKKYLSTKDGRLMDKVPAPSASFPDLISLTMKAQTLLDRSAASAVIGDLVENPNVASWVNTGLELHTSGAHTSNCLFCNQQMPESRLKQLEAHFNDEFKKLQSDLDELAKEIESAKDFEKAIRLPDKAALYEYLRDEYEKSASTMSQQAFAVRQYLEIILQALKVKRDEPFKRFNLHPFIGEQSSSNPPSTIQLIFSAVSAGLMALSSVVGKNAFDKVAALIEQHNSDTDGFAAKVDQARNALVADEVLNALSEWRKKTAALVSVREEADLVREEITNIQNKIIALEMDVRQHRRPAEELNEEVAAYLGRDELRFEVEQNGYRISRNGHPAIHLSDGERTAIAFLYFLKSLKGTDFELERGVVVVDDPVSSLDTNSLFSAFGFMKQRTAMAGQLFVLTHNFTFFRQVRNWYYNLPGQKKSDIAKRPARFYMLETYHVDGVRSARIEVLDPFLHQYESEYHYLFKRVYEEAQKPAGQSLESYYAIPNIARRLLESFLAFRVPDKPGELFQKLESVQFDTVKKTRILRFLHTYSHFDQIAEAQHDASVLSETPAILRDVLSLIQACDAEHFRCMSALILTPSA